MYRAGEYVPLSLDEAVETCADMHDAFAEKDVPVIRTGLHPLRDAGEDVITGPYHPAFGFLVKARLRRREMEMALRESLAEAKGPVDAAEIIIPRRNSEEYVGHGRENIVYLKEVFRLTELRVETGEAETPEVLIIPV